MVRTALTPVRSSFTTPRAGAGDKDAARSQGAIRYRSQQDSDAERGDTGNRGCLPRSLEAAGRAVSGYPANRCEDRAASSASSPGIGQRRSLLASKWLVTGRTTARRAWIIT